MLGMIGLPRRISSARTELGLTQGELAALAGASLATLQNLEAGRANPSLSTLERILTVLGMELELCQGEADWDILAALGVPMQKSGGPTVQPSPELLHIHLRHALAEVGGLQSDSGESRKQEALWATLVALKHHFPTYYARHFGRSPLAKSFDSREVSGRVVGLARIAADNLARYL